MIPLRLQLKNFMSYGEGVPPLELSGVRLACLSGDNGNGKTALLDAMTWALFGETRATSEDDVIRLGATDCRVMLDFEVGGQKYRIHKARGKRGGNIWELQIWQEDGSTRSLSGTSARETKAKIEQILRMDYKTFLASGYLAQGKADEFSRATVTDRKKVLADILDLSRYERLEEMAKERRKEAEDRETDADRTIRSIDAELESEDRFFLLLEAARVRLQEANSTAEQLRTDHEKRLSQIEKLEGDEEKATNLTERVRDVEDEIIDNEKQLAQIEARLAQAEIIVARKAEIEASYQTFVTLTETIKPLEDQYDAILALQREAQGLERQIQAEYEKADRERYRLECDIQTLELEAREESRYNNDIAEVEAQIAAFGDPEAKRKAAEDRRNAADESLLGLKAEHASLKTEEGALDKRISALEESRSALCDYCGQPLPPAKRQGALDEALAARETIREKQSTVALKGREAKKQSDRYKEEIEQAQIALRQISGFEARLAQGRQELHRLTARTATLPDVRKRFERFTLKVAQKDYAHAEQERLMKIAADLEKSERVGEQLNAVRAELARHAQAERNLLQLQNAEEVCAMEPPRAQDLRERIVKRQGQIEKAQKQIGDIYVRIAALPTLRSEQSLAAGRLREAEEAARASEREIGQYESKLVRCAEQKEARARWVEALREAAKEKDLYKELVGAFGKKGVQALIIENALPEIQNQTNDLLGKLTDGAMTVQLVTQREAKTKNTGAIETLDIIISDQSGTRPYEMYSGGEAFRVNLALRVALSKMLARRAGAPLQTLLIDEGFGTQDPRGREAIADALHIIADDFALVLVITHIEEIKEQFPVRIEVVKGPTGSTFTVATG